jgi:hypothetical protein
MVNLEKVKKLTPNLHHKERYIIHYKLLNYFLSLGQNAPREALGASPRCIVTNIHRILYFSEEPWMKDYIDFNTKKRAAAKNKFEQDFFKLLNNSVYGKDYGKCTEKE